MQAIMETLFDVFYLSTVLILGIKMIQNAKGNRVHRLYGIMALILGFGDAFHLVPRAYALCTTGLESHVAALGFGKLVTSITMTVFYVLLYFIWKIKYKITKRNELTFTFLVLAVTRILLCFMPENKWLSPDAPLEWGIYRNIPFAIMGVIIIVIYYKEAHKKNDHIFRFMWLAVTLSFAFYIPVVLWADAVPMIGMLMIPKTIAYVWIIWMGYSDSRKRNGLYAIK